MPVPLGAGDAAIGSGEQSSIVSSGLFRKSGVLWPPAPYFKKQFILNRVKVPCLETLLQVLI